MKTIDTETWKQELSEFKEKTKAFYAGEMDKGSYKGFSGYYGSYAQRGGKSSMLRLRITAGRLTKEKMAFTAEAIRKYHVKKLHFTTCQTIQLHNLGAEEVYGIMEEALDAGIITLGGGGDYPRNVMCPPLSGVEKEEYFDVLPWAMAAGEYLMNFIKAEKMPRKLKVGFSNSSKNETHATFRDLGFVARADKTFDVYSAGGLGNHPKFGVKVSEAVVPEKILYYIKAMWLTFRAYGNYENRGKARTRYMQDSLGGAENYAKAFNEKLLEVFNSREDLTIQADPVVFQKQGDDSIAEGSRIIEQKQPGLYTVVWHPLGGQPTPEKFCELSDVLMKIPDAEIRLSPDETAYIINLTGDEAKRVVELTKDGADTLFETSVSCIGASICQVGVRDSQALLTACVKAVREAKIPDKALPQIHISGCPSSCGTHQIGVLGFRGGVKSINKKPEPAFVLFVDGNDRQGEEAMGRELGTILETEIPSFLVELGKTVAESGKDFISWKEENPEYLEDIAQKFLCP